MRIRQLFSFFVLALLFAGTPAFAQSVSADLIAAAGADGALSDAELAEISIALANEGNTPAQVAAALQNVNGPNNTPIAVTPAQVATGLATTGITQAQVTATVASSMNISNAAANTASQAGFTAATNVAGATTIAAGTNAGQNTQAANAVGAITLSTGGAFTSSNGTAIIIRSPGDLSVAVAAYVNGLGNGSGTLTTEQRANLTSLINSTPALQGSTLATAITDGSNLNKIKTEAAKTAAQIPGTTLPPDLTTS